MNRLLLAAVAILAMAASLTVAPPSPAAAVEAASSAAEDCEDDPGAPSTPALAEGTPVASSTPVGTTPCPGVRPGGYAQFHDTAGQVRGYCTLNFVWRGTDSDGRVTMYIGSAGHCVIDSGERSWDGAKGPGVFDTAGKRIGNVSYAVNSGNRDFALIRIAPGVSYSPRMCHFGGPRGTNNDRPQTGVIQLRHYGQGLGTGDTLPARTAVTRGMPDPNRILATGAVAPGDSGSPVLAPDGRAVAVVVTVGVHYNISDLLRPQTGTVGMTRVAPQINRAAAVLKRTMRIQTAPLA